MKHRSFLLFCLVLGVVMRLIWTSDMEWKDDEKIMYDLANETAAKGNFPGIGMMSGGGVVNPGLSVAVFSGLSYLSDTPVGMARCVQVMNVLALLLLAWFAGKIIPFGEREVWLYGIALAAVSPLAVLFARKIWAQDTLPFFTSIIIIAMHYRNRKAAAFIFGWLSMLIGQIHMSGFFLATGWIAFSFLYDLYHRNKIQWIWFIAGAVIGLIPLIPWLQYVSENKQGSYLLLKHVLQFRVYIYGFLDSLGLNLVYTFEKEIGAFYAFPRFYLVGAIYILLLSAAAFTLYLNILLIRSIFKQIKTNGFIQYIFHCSVARFYLQGIFIGLGILMTFSGTEIYPHYLICVFPFTYIALSRLYSQHRNVFKGIVICQAALSVLFLLYVHVNDGIKDGDYGVTYKKQVAK
jgi:hypothetical protein